MIKNKLKYIWFILILLNIGALFLYLRMNATLKIKATAYSEWHEHFVVENGSSAYIKTNKDTDTDIVLSEGQGYGMLIAVEAAEKGLASQEDFNKLYQYYLDNRLEGTALMSWQQAIASDGSSSDGNNATDGDLYIAYALLQAAKLWQDSAQEYQEQAKLILQDLLTYDYNSDLQILTVGNWATSDSNYHNLMRTSDVMPAQFEAFYDVTGDDIWLTIEDSMLGKLNQMSEQNSTGLIPDFMWVTADGVTAAEANAISSDDDGNYYYNACRVPYQLAQSNHETAQTVLDKMMTFFTAQPTVRAGYTLAGDALNDYQSASFIAPIFYAASQGTGYDELIQENKFIFTQDLSDEEYYEMALTTMIALDIF